jgi:hypothetical protein
VILRSTDATATCLTGPSFTTAEVNSTQGGGSQHVLSVGSASGSPPSVSVLASNGANSGPIGPAEQEQTSVDGQPYTLLQGQIQPGIAAAMLVLSDGSRVQATIADGSLVAWWPRHADATSADLTSGTGATAQQLAFTPAPPPTHTNADRAAPHLITLKVRDGSRPNVRLEGEGAAPRSRYRVRASGASVAGLPGSSARPGSRSHSSGRGRAHPPRGWPGGARSRGREGSTGGPAQAPSRPQPIGLMTRPWVACVAFPASCGSIVGVDTLGVADTLFVERRSTGCETRLR